VPRRQAARLARRHPRQAHRRLHQHGGKKRWFTCTECHNPHNVQDGTRNKGFVQLQPETPPQLPRGMKDAGTRSCTRSRALMADAPETRPERGDPTWVPPALTRDEQTRHVGKTPVFFGPPLAILTAGRRTRWRSAASINRTAERYLELMRLHGWS
jgi:hypothetical protein